MQCALHGLVLRKEDGHVLRKALDLAVESQRKKGRPKRTWMKQVNGGMKSGLCMEDPLFRSKLIVGINQIATRLTKSDHPLVLVLVLLLNRI